MAETPNVCHSLHMPLQSGSDAVLRAMRRSYRSERYLGIIDKVRAAMPDAAITTDIIVGFPGETEADFERTLDVVREARFAGGVHLPVLQAPRHAGRHHGRPGAQAGRAGALRAADRRASRRSPGRRTSSWSARPSRCWSRSARAARTSATGRMSGRARDGRLVHFAAAPTAARSGPGDIVHTTVTYAAPHHLNADGAAAVATGAPGPATRARPAASPVPRGAARPAHHRRPPRARTGVRPLAAVNGDDEPATDVSGPVRAGRRLERQSALLGELEELPLGGQRLLGLADRAWRRRRPAPGPAAASASATCSRIWASSGLASGVGAPPGRVHRRADLVLDGAQPPVEPGGGLAGHPAGVVPLALDLAQPGLRGLRVGVDVERLGLGEQRLLAVQVGLLLGVAGGEDLAAPGEERVLRGPEPLPELLLGLLGRRAARPSTRSSAP